MNTRVTGKELAALLFGIHTHKDDKGIVYPEKELLKILEYCGLPVPEWGEATTLDEFIKTKEKGKIVTNLKEYTITVKTYEDKTDWMVRINDGFTPLELIGLAEFVQMEVKDQIKGLIKPDVVIRQVIVDEDKK